MEQIFLWQLTQVVSKTFLQIGQTVLHIIANNGAQEQLINYLIDNGANIDAIDEEGNTPLMIAARRENIQLVELFLEKGKNCRNQ